MPFLIEKIRESIERYFPMLSKTNFYFGCIISGFPRNKYHVGIKYAKSILRKISVRDNGKGAWLGEP